MKGSPLYQLLYQNQPHNRRYLCNYINIKMVFIECFVNFICKLLIAHMLDITFRWMSGLGTLHSAIDNLQLLSKL